METEFQYQGLSGHVLSNNERSSLLISRPLLQEQYQGRVAFWGKVTGVTQDYVVCTVTGEHVFDRKFVCSTDGGLNWILLEPTLPEQRPYCDQIHGLFTGNPQYEYKIEEFIDPPPAEPVQEASRPGTDEDEDEEDEEEGGQNGENDGGSDNEGANEDEDEEGAGGGRGGDADGDRGGGEDDEGEEGEEGGNDGKDKRRTPQPLRRIVAVKELTRLAHFVEDVEHHCRVIPRGLLMLENENLVPNKFFQGLSLQDSGRLTHYLHSRPRKEAPKLGTTFTDCFDCLDSIVDDIPTGVWTLKHDPLFQLVVGNNLLFPGFTFYNKPDTATFGQYYFGSGERNLDICFML